MPVTEAPCPHCGEVQASDNHRCARCGESLETKEQKKQRLAVLELSRREAERNNVAIVRLPGFGVNGDLGAKFGTREFFSQMSNQMRRRYFVVFGVIAISFIFILTR